MLSGQLVSGRLISCLSAGLTPIRVSLCPVSGCHTGLWRSFLLLTDIRVLSLLWKWEPTPPEAWPHRGPCSEGCWSRTSAERRAHRLSHVSPFTDLMWLISHCLVLCWRQEWLIYSKDLFFLVEDHSVRELRRNRLRMSKKGRLAVILTGAIALSTAWLVCHRQTWCRWSFHSWSCPKPFPIVRHLSLCYQRTTQATLPYCI